MYKLIALFIGVILLAGCSTSRDIGTHTELTPDKYRIIKAGATGESYGFRLLGIFPITSANFAAAKADLYESSGITEKKSILLLNQREDRSVLYVILFAVPKVTFTADVVELIEKPVVSSVPASDAK